LKRYKKQKINYLPLKHKEKKSEILFEVDGNLDIMKISIYKPKFSCELNVPILDTDKNKIKILSSIDKLTTAIPSFPDKIEPSIESFRPKNHRSKH
jgi:hypothetical protein